MDQLLQKLQQFDTPTICNVIELFNVRTNTEGYFDSSIRSNFPELPPMVGYAATVTCRTAIPPRAGDAYHRLTDQVERFGELSGAPVVVFQDIDNPVAAATFGEIMCTTYQTFGAVGLITSGAGRDLEQVRAIQFPVFTGSTIASHGHIQILQLHVPVHVGGLVIYPDDLLHGDLNGVTTIPGEIAPEIADAATEFVAAERIILDTLHSEAASLEQVKAAIAEADDRMAALKRRVTRTPAS